MKNRKSLFVVLLLAFIAAFSLMIAACGDSGKQNETTKYAITWSYDSQQVDIVATGYESLPTELDAGTEVVFTATPKTGYEITTVTPSKSVVKQSDGTYKFTVADKITVRVSSKEIINSLTVSPLTTTYYAGQTIDTADLTVTANYAVKGDVVTQDYGLTYQNGDALSLGDTYVTVSFGGIEKKIEFASPIVGKVTLNLAGGSFTADQLSALSANDGYAYDSENGIVEWTFSSALASTVNLPSPTKVINGNAMPFLRWTGVTNNQIPTGTSASVTATAYYDAQLVDVKSLNFVKEDGVPYLVITGEFKAATEAYLYLYEGNDDIELVGPTVTNANGNQFTLKFDLRELANKKTEDGGDYKGKWMDIRFCAKAGERVETQEINLKNYDANFVNTLATVEGDCGDAWYQFGYKTWKPTAGDLITGGQGAAYLGTEKLLKLYYQDCPAVSTESVYLEERNDTPYLIIKGTAILTNTGATITTKEEAETAVEQLYVDVQEMTTWGYPTCNILRTPNDNFTYELAIELTNLEQDKEYFMHFNTASDNFAVAVTAGTIKIGTIEYTLSNHVADDWTNDLVWLVRDDTSLGKVNINSVGLKEVDGKASLVFTGTYRNYTLEELKALVIDGEADNGRVIMPIDVSVDEANGTFTIVADISDENTFPVADFYYMHAGFEAQPDNLASGTCQITSGMRFLVSNGKLYTLSEQWSVRGVVIAAIPASDYTFTNATVEEHNGKVCLAVSGTYEKYTADEVKALAFKCDLQCNPNAAADGSGDWTKNVLTVSEVVAADGRFTVYLEIGELANYKYTTHLSVVDGDGDAADLKIYTEINETYTIGTKTYTIISVPGSSDGAEYWGCIGVVIADAQ
jgi:hypothetical protein